MFTIDSSSETLNSIRLRPKIQSGVRHPFHPSKGVSLVPRESITSAVRDLFDEFLYIIDDHNLCKILPGKLNGSGPE